MGLQLCSGVENGKKEKQLPENSPATLLKPEEKTSEAETEIQPEVFIVKMHLSLLHEKPESYHF